MLRKVDLGEWEYLRVKYVSKEMTDRPGRWTIVESNEDFKRRFVEKGEKNNRIELKIVAFVTIIFYGNVYIES